MAIRRLQIAHTLWCVLTGQREELAFHFPTVVQHGSESADEARSWRPSVMLGHPADVQCLRRCLELGRDCAHPDIRFGLQSTQRHGKIIEGGHPGSADVEDDRARVVESLGGDTADRVRKVIDKDVLLDALARRV